MPRQEGQTANMMVFVRYFLLIVIVMVAITAAGCDPSLDVPSAQELLRNTVGGDTAPLYCSTRLGLRKGKPATWYGKDAAHTDRWRECANTLKKHELVSIELMRQDDETVAIPYVDAPPMLIEPIAGHSMIRGEQLTVACGTRTFKVTAVKRSGNTAIIHYRVTGNVPMETILQLEACDLMIANLDTPSNEETPAILSGGKWQLVDKDVLKP